MIPQTLLWRPLATRQFARLHPDMRRRIAASLDRYAASGEGDVGRSTGKRLSRFA